ncbi:MAG: SprT-like domain-containing protein [Candidatus Rokuibacteriota bacterium]
MGCYASTDRGSAEDPAASRCGRASSPTPRRCVSVLHMPPTGSETLEVNRHGLLQDWGHRWGLPALGQSVQVEWGRRFRRSLGRVHLDRRLVRLSAELAAAPITVLHEVLCHEVAHLAARDLHGRHCQPHGPEWVTLVRAVGFEARPRIPWSAPPSPSHRIAPRRRYVHHCPVCHFQRAAGRPVRQWRCAECVAVGLSGRLEISSLPTRQRP